MEAKPSAQKIEKKPKAPLSWSFGQKFNQAKDFLRFLETERINLSEGILKKKIQKMYNKEYKTYREQVAPSEKLIPYHLCMRTLFNKNIVHLQGSYLHKGARPSPSPEREMKNGIESGKMQNKTGATESTVGDSATKSENKSGENAQQTSSSKRRRRRIKRSTFPADSKPVIPEHSVKKQMADRLQSLRKKRQWPVKVAVDQHLTIHRPEPQTEDVTDQQGVSQSVNVADMKYIKKVEDENLFACRVCHTTCTSEADVERHLRGKVHRLAVVMDRLKTMR